MSTLVAKALADATAKASFSEDKTYREQTLFTPYKYEHASSEHDLGFAFYFDGELGFESETAKIAGPYLKMKSKDFLEFYNLRYGATSTHAPSEHSLSLIYFAEVAFSVMMVLQWALLICICCELKKKRHVESPDALDQTSLDQSVQAQPPVSNAIVRKVTMKQ